jgi:hypothetical protein
MMLDTLPSRPELDEAGNLRGSPIAVALFALLIPAITIAVNLFLLAKRISG